MPKNGTWATFYQSINKMQIFFENDTRVGGPSKLIKNLKMGLDLVNEQYECNPSQINLKDKILFTQNHPLLNFCDLSNVIIGPNICVLPIDSKIVMEQKYNKIITPCNWVYNKYKKWINEDKIVIWPVGIDTNLFRDTSKDEKNYDCLIYVKNRTPEELEFVMEMMAEFDQTFNVVRYGSYNEEMFLDSISKSRYCFMLDNTESQGIATQEILSSNLPMFTWDINYWDHRGNEYTVPATSVPYWDSTCGEKLIGINKNDIKELFSIFLSRQNEYKPRYFIEKNLNLKERAKQLLSFYN